MRKIITHISGWRKSNATTYKECHQLYGGSFLTHPDVLAFLHERYHCQPKYYAKHNPDGTPQGAFCTWKGNYLAGDASIFKRIGIRYAFNKDEIILPLHSATRSTIPFQTKYLSEINRQNVWNASFSLNSHRGICIARGCGTDGFSPKTKNRRNNELKKFLNAGGTVHDQSEFSPHDLTEIFAGLYETRWGHPLSNRLEIYEAFKELRHFFFGHVLMLNEKPCAFQLITKAVSPHWINFDYVNGGYNQTYKSFCPGTVVTWLNVKAAYELSVSKGKIMRYSFGRPTAEYKDRWCKIEQLGRVI